MSTAPTAALRFLLDGERVELQDPPPATTTLLDWLREHGRCGTKEGCAEGDCGACTVVLGEPHEGGLRYRAVNSCIRFLATVDGRELVTAEGLQHGEQLHPVQQALVDHHGSQCGFCTPGFVMSLFALYLEDSAPTRERVVDALSGNLCRCTGYRPIIDAGCHMGAYPQPARWSRAEAAAPARRAALNAVTRGESLKFDGFHAPRTLAEFAQAYLDAPDSLVLAGGTDIGLWHTQELRALPPLLYIGEVAELQAIVHEADTLHIGAAVCLEDAWTAIVAWYPQLAELAQRFASPPVRHSGTLCGNLANGSPIGDAMPALIALGARLKLRRGEQTRELPLEAFYLGYRQKALQRGEFVEAVCIPKPAANLRYACYKLSKRYDQDISAVCAAFALQIEHGLIVDARIAYGGMAAIPARAPATEAALLGRPWCEASIEAAIEQLGKDYAPLSDMRASAAYRLRTAGNLLRRYWLEQSHSARVLRTGEVRP